MTGTRRPLVAANWKMHMTGAEAREYLSRFVELLGERGEIAADIALCPPFTALEIVAAGVAYTPVWVAAQNIHEAAAGAHTGEVSAAMIAGAGAEGAIIGHSERRAMGESDELVARRVRVALDGGLNVILCVGESLAQREAGQTEDWLTRQLEAALEDVTADDVDGLAIAYEPIWAIGTGRTATPEMAQAACAHVRAVAGEFMPSLRVRVLYGGSVTPANAAGLMAGPDIDGVLVGGASLDPDAFMAIVDAAAG